MRSPIYRSPALYRLAMRLLCGAENDEALRRVAEMIPDESRVVDLCAGDCAIYFRELRRKRVRYTAVDLSPEFTASARRRGLDAINADVRTFSLPECDVVLLLRSAYQFPENFRRLVEESRVRARLFIALESVENLARSGNPFLRRFAGWMTDFGEGPVEFRYTEEELRKEWSELGAVRIERLGRELLGVWRFSSERL